MKKYWPHIAALVIAMLIGGSTSLKLGQDINYDLLNYHYNNPHALLHNQVERNIAVGGIVSYENPLRDVPGYLLISTLSPKKAGVALGMIHGINMWLIFEIVLLLFARFKAKYSLKVLLAAFVGILSFYGAGNISVVGSTMGDNLTSIFVLSGLLLLLYSFHKPAACSPQLLRLAAYLLVGISVGLKLTNVVYAVALLLAGLVIEGRPWERLKQAALHASALLAGIIAIAGFWYVKLLLVFQNPIFPFYNAVFRSEYYPESNFIDARWTATSFWQGITEPFSYGKMQAISSEIPFRDPRLGVTLSLLLLLATFYAVRRWIFKKKAPLAYWSRQHSILLIFFVVSYLAWSMQFSYYRYLITAELVSLAVITIVVFAVIRRFWVAQLC